jgi:hypothetical protein
MSPRESPTSEGVRAHLKVRHVVTWRRVVRMATGLVLTLLGSLWVLQGADLVRIQPIACLTECRPLTGGSPVWFAIGLLTLLGGLVVLGARRPR